MDKFENEPTPRQKAMELLYKFNSVPLLKDFEGMDKELQAQCALVLANEIVNEALTQYTNDENHDRVEFWRQVITELKQK